MNLATFMIGTLIAAAFTAIIVSAVKNRKFGGCSCGGSCSGCQMKGICHKQNDK